MPLQSSGNPEAGIISNQSPSPTHVRFIVMAFLCGLSFLTYFDRVCIVRAQPDIKRDLNINDSQMGWILGAFWLAYALFEIPGGWLGDRYARGGRWAASSSPGQFLRRFRARQPGSFHFWRAASFSEREKPALIRAWRGCNPGGCPPTPAAFGAGSSGFCAMGRGFFAADFWSDSSGAQLAGLAYCNGTSAGPGGDLSRAGMADRVRVLRARRSSLGCLIHPMVPGRSGRTSRRQRRRDGIDSRGRRRNCSRHGARTEFAYLGGAVFKPESLGAGRPLFFRKLRLVLFCELGFTLFRGGAPRQIPEFRDHERIAALR